MTARAVLCAASIGAFVALGGPAFAQTTVSASGPASDARFAVRAFALDGENPLGEMRAQEVLRPYLGEQRGRGGLETAAKALEDALRAAGYGLYRVKLPPQNVTDTVQLSIVRVPLVNVVAMGQKYFDEANVRASVPGLEPGSSPDMKTVARQIALANENPAKKTTLRMQPAQDGSGVVATLDTTDKNPWLLALGANDSGTGDTGRARVVGLLQYANLFDLDQVVGLAYTTSPSHPGDVKQYGLYYKAPVYTLGGALSAHSSYSSVNTGVLASGQVITGRGNTTGLAYTQYFYPVGNYRSSLALGIDDKLFRPAVVGGVVQPGTDVRSRPFSLVYSGSLTPAGVVFDYNFEYAHNLSSGSDNTLAAYSANRPGANNNWEAYRLNYKIAAPLFAGWSMAARFHGQWAPHLLISGEQLGLGGADSVRGVDERVITGDTGLQSTIEIYTPDISPGVRLLGFFDSGAIKRYDPPLGTPAHDQLSSVGLGLRWSWNQSGSLAVDYGRLTKSSNLPYYPAGTDMVHANLLYRF